MEIMNYDRQLSVYRDVDVLVVGGGPAGVCAAISAARMGAKTFIFDENGSIGGAATNGLVGPFMTSFSADGERQVIKGIFEEFVNRMVEKGGAIHPREVRSPSSRAGFYHVGHDRCGPFDHECFKVVGVEMLREAGAELLLHTRFVDVMMEGRRVSGVVIANKSGLSAIRAKVVVDCSGDADVAMRAGAGFDLGRVEDGNMQPATLFFRVNNVDSDRLKAHIAEHDSEIRPFYGPLSWLIREKPEAWGDTPRAEVCMFEGVQPGEYRLNVTRILDVDGTNAEDLTRAELEGMRQAHNVYRFLKGHAPGFENARFMGTAAMVGVRETRHIHGLQRLTEADVRAARVPDDVIAVMATNMDTHNKSDPGGTYYTLENGQYFGVPYGCLVPEATENLLVAGRSISTDAMAGSATRMIPCCMVFGQAAGTAAAMAVKQGTEVARVDVAVLQKQLVRDGAFLGDGWEKA